MSKIKLNRKLNIAFPVDTPNGRVWVHSTPLSRMAFEDNFLVISRAFTAIYTNGLGPITGPRVAKLMLKREAEAMGNWDRVQGSLVMEIHRLTNVAAPGPKGWETLPFNEAIKREVISPDTAEEVENAIVFFTFASAINLPQEFEMAMDTLRTLWQAQTMSWNVTEFIRSSLTLTPAETTGEKPAEAASPASSIPV